jgi:hypothetical protein
MRKVVRGAKEGSDLQHWDDKACRRIHMNNTCWFHLLFCTATCGNIVEIGNSDTHRCAQQNLQCNDCVYDDSLEREKVKDKTVGKSASYADVVRGTHRNDSDVADVVRQPLVNGRM